MRKLERLCKAYQKLMMGANYRTSPLGEILNKMEQLILAELNKLEK